MTFATAGLSFLAESSNNPADEADHQNINDVTISELLLLDRVLDKDKKFNCVATITGIDASDGWYYNACIKCKNGIRNFNGMLTCKRCGPTNTPPMAWYMLSMTVDDDTNNAKFMLFGKHVERLLKIPATSLVDFSGIEKFTVPPVMEQLIGKRYKFQVSISE